MPVYQEPYHKLVLEKPEARVLNVQVEPGDTSLFHIHANNIFYVAISGSKVMLEDSNHDVRKVELPDGWIGDNTTYQARPHIHRIANIGENLLWLVAVENLHNPADNKHFNQSSKNIVLQDNSFTVYKYLLHSNEIITEHSHKFPCLLINISRNAKLQAINKISAKISSLNRGGYLWLEKGVVHEISNLGGAELEFLEVLIK